MDHLLAIKTLIHNHIKNSKRIDLMGISSIINDIFFEVYLRNPNETKDQENREHEFMGEHIKQTIRSLFLLLIKMRRKKMDLPMDDSVCYSMDSVPNWDLDVLATTLYSEIREAKSFYEMLSRIGFNEMDKELKSFNEIKE